MNRLLILTFLSIFLSSSFLALAQFDDVYFDPNEDMAELHTVQAPKQTTRNSTIRGREADRGAYASERPRVINEDEYDSYDRRDRGYDDDYYAYEDRIRRFHNPRLSLGLFSGFGGGWGWNSGFAMGVGWGDPWLNTGPWGFNSWNRWNSPWGWNRWNAWNSPWGWNDPFFNSWGFNGWNRFGSFYCPPNGYYGNGLWGRPGVNRDYYYGSARDGRGTQYSSRPARSVELTDPNRRISSPENRSSDLRSGEERSRVGSTGSTRQNSRSESAREQSRNAQPNVRSNNRSTGTNRSEYNSRRNDSYQSSPRTRTNESRRSYRTPDNSRSSSQGTYRRSSSNSRSSYGPSRSSSTNRSSYSSPRSSSRSSSSYGSGRSSSSSSRSGSRSRN